MSDQLIVKVNVSENPWISSYKEFSFSRNKIESIAKNLVGECSGRDYSSSYSYGKHVSLVMENLGIVHVVLSFLFTRLYLLF